MLTKYRIAVVGVFSLFSCAAVPGGEVERQVQTAMDRLVSKTEKCKAIIKDTLGVSFKEQIDKSLDQLRKDPRSLERQLRVIDILMAQADRLHKSLRKTKDANLGSMRDRVVAGLDALFEVNKTEQEYYLAHAEECNEREWKQRYEELAAICGRLARAYAVRAEQYRAVPITRQLVEIQSSLDYLESVKAVLGSLRDGIITILSDEEALREFQRLSVTIDGVQASLKTFSEVVLAGALADEEGPASGN